MIAIKRLRGVAALTTVLAIGAFGLPSTALAGKSHILKMYKVEDHVDIEGDLDYNVSCRPGDIATDGMWRIDDVSQDNEFDLLGQWKETLAVKAIATSLGTYQFRFLPLAGGDVQGKIWVTCLENPAGPGGTHAHNFTTKPVTATPAAETGPNGAVSYVVGPGSGGGSLAAGDCPTGQYVPIQPGFDMTATEGYGYLQKSWNATTGTDVGWEWRFNVTSAAAAPASDNFSVTLKYRCLKLKSDPSTGPSPGPHSHRIIQQYKSKLNINHVQRTFDTHQVNCGEQYKGMVGMWDTGSNDLYYLGMDPRIKSRAFRFVNIGFADQTVDLRLSCFKDRTS